MGKLYKTLSKPYIVGQFGSFNGVSMSDDKKPEVLKYFEPRRVIRMDSVDEKMEALAKKGIFFFGGPITEGVSYQLILNIGQLKKTEPNKPIWLVMKSPGGFVDEGFAVYDAIKAFVKNGVEINILCMGLIASMGASILQAASRRYSFPNTQFMIHEVSQTIMAREKASESDERNAEIKRINNIVLGHLAERTGLDLKKIKEDVHKTDVWLDAEGARNFGPNGLIDEVVDVFPFEF